MTGLTLAFTCCDRAYEDFAPLFAASLLGHDPNAAVEIGVEDFDRFLTDHGASWSLVTAAFPSRTCVRNVEWSRGGRRILPNTVRFLETPVTESDYVYICDVDYVILGEIAPAHLEIMRRRRAPYSNAVRPGTRRLSGLHFTERAAHYPLPDPSHLPLWTMGDEEILYEIVKRKGIRLYGGEERPRHGIHISPQRSPFQTSGKGGRPVPGWGVWGFVDRFRAFADTHLMAELRPTLSARVEACLEEIEKICAFVLAARRASAASPGAGA